MKLNTLIYNINRILSNEHNNVFAEYELTSLEEHEDVYIVTSAQKVTLKNQFIKGTVKNYQTQVDFKVRVLGKPSVDPFRLYGYMDNQVINCLSEAGYYLKSAEIGKLYFDKSLKRMILEGLFVIEASAETEE